ncbi:hypothetical protein EJB05_35100, partial [Eragrostis curvula]
MDVSQHQSAAAATGDRLSTLQDSVLSRILSFLPAKEAAHAALLSPRWRDVFAGVDTVVLEEPESPIREPTDDGGSPGWGPQPDPNQPPPFSSLVSAALLGRNRRVGAAPLRKLRVAVGGYSRSDSCTMDQWVNFAVQQASADGLHLDLRLRCHRRLCPRPCSLRSAGQGDRDDGKPILVSTAVSVPDGEEAVCEVKSPPCREASADADTDDDSSVLSDDDSGNKTSSFNDRPWWEVPEYIYTITRTIFSCAELRSLSLSFCQLAPPTNVSMPSLQALLLSHVSDPGSDIERLICGSPRLTDLTLEASDAVTALSVLCGVRLRRLALRCCHNLATVAVDSSELHAFDYRGAVPNNTFLTLHGGCLKVVYCRVDICGEEVYSEDDLTKLRQLLQPFANARYLHLESARLGMGLNTDVPVRFPSFSSLHHLELRGRLPDNDTTIVAAISRMLEHSLNLEALTMVFHPEKDDDRWSRNYPRFRQGDLLDEHYLDYNPHSTLNVPCGAIPCLRSHVREINLVHYQGGRAQRTLSKFLLSNALVMDELYCELAEGPLWTQTQLTQEIKGWVVNKSAKTHIS